MHKRAFSSSVFSLIFLAGILGAASTHAAQTVNVFLVGTGFVGSSLLQQINEGHAEFQRRYNIDLRVVSIANGRTWLFDKNGIALDDWKTGLTCGSKMDWPDFENTMLASELPNRVFVDCTSNQDIADSYLRLLDAGISVSTPSKKAASSEYARFTKLKRHPQFFYDANVGAALPIISTIKGLRRGGDEIVKVEGVLSGTLSYLFNSLSPEKAFSKIVKEAQSKGYTEPDPRDDLNGLDAARKLLIIARDSGARLEMQDVELEPFLPKECFAAASVEDFYVELGKFDHVIASLRDQALAQGKRLRFIATYAHGKARLSLETVGAEHPFYNLSGTDNIVAITTRNFDKSPLVIKGPGAGPEVTAARVLEGVVRGQLMRGAKVIEETI